MDIFWTLKNWRLFSICHTQTWKRQKFGRKFKDRRTTNKNFRWIVGDAAKDSEISAFGVTNFRGLNQQFGIRRSDRGRHVYIIGQTGTGKKSGLLELLFALSDIFHNQGYAIIDPHGDFAIDNLKFVPPSRIKDVVYFNLPTPRFRSASTRWKSQIPPCEQHFLGNHWRFETYVRRQLGAASGIYFALHNPCCASWISRHNNAWHYANADGQDFSRKSSKWVKDTVVLQFWRVEFSSWQDKFVAEAIAPI